MATYDDILAKIQASQDKLGGDSISVSQKSPQLEALMGVYGPELANLLTSEIDMAQCTLNELQKQVAELKQGLEQGKNFSLLGESTNG